MGPADGLGCWIYPGLGTGAGELGMYWPEVWGDINITMGEGAPAGGEGSELPGLPGID